MSTAIMGIARPLQALLAIVILAMAMPVRAQQATMAQVTASVDRALALQTAGQFQQAAQSLEQALSWCQGAAFQPDCRRVVLYSLGYVHQVEARRDPANQERLLQAAVTHYRNLLNEQPQYGQAVYNLALVYREMGPHEWQESFLRDAPRADPTRRATYETLLGDYYQDRRMWTQAITTYRRAMQADADDVAPRRGLLDAYGAMAPAGNRELLALAIEWTPRFPELATEAFELIVRGAFATGAATTPDRTVEQALVRWVAQLARQRRIDAIALTGIPTGWTPAADLHRYLDAPYTTPPFGNWWMGDDDRRKVLAEVSLALGQRKLQQGEPDRAEACWTAGKAILPPIFEQILNLKRELAMLWFRRPELDPGGRKFDALERELFLEKAGVLGAGDLEAGQRYHTALAIIYFEKKTWQSPRRGWNAVDQLTWALDKARERERSEKFYQPLPELKSMLGQALEQTPERARAAAIHGEAAQAFLDADNLTAATDASARAAGPGAGRPYAALIAHRLRIDSLAENATQLERACERAAIERALTPPAGLRRAATFTARQRFKMLADCSRAGPQERRLEYAADAFAMAVTDSVSLVGIADLLRFERASATVLGSVGMRTGEHHIEFDNAAGAAGFVRISLPTQARAGRIDVPRQAALAGLIVQLVGPRVPLRLRIEDQEITVQAPEGAFRADVMRRIAAFPNVSTVQAAPSGVRIRM
ncbi:MAG: hypothetical protein ACRENP_16320 [Longimicrobiales bacterium]